MLKIFKGIVSIGLICLLSACATTNTRSPEQEQKAKTAKINAQLGIAYLERHNLQRSKQKLLLALEQGPTIPETWYSMAYFLEATGNKDDASIYYQKAISIAPTRGDAQNNYGTFLCRNGDYRGAVEHFMLAVKDPTYLDPADAYENAGLCALKIPDNKMAAKYFAQAIAQDPARTVSERKLKELNKYLAMDDGAANATNALQPAPKRIAYKSLRHQRDDEDDEQSGLVKIPDLIKAKRVVVGEPVRAPFLGANAAAPQQTASKVKITNQSFKGASVTTPTQTASKAKATHESFKVERVALKPKVKNRVAIKSKAKRVKPATVAAAKVKHKKPIHTAKLKHNVKAKLARATVKKKHHELTKGTVEV